MAAHRAARSIQCHASVAGTFAGVNRLGVSLLRTTPEVLRHTPPLGSLQSSGAHPRLTITVFPPFPRRGLHGVRTTEPGIGVPWTLRTRGRILTVRPTSSVPSTSTLAYSSGSVRASTMDAMSRRVRSGATSAASRASSSPLFHSYRSSCHLHRNAHTALGLMRSAYPSRVRALAPAEAPEVLASAADAANPAAEVVIPWRKELAAS
mmetsp:Transcript_11128/g.51602  ORF Transcript_11128/g.51602 Transcript_11128/m.51602 type:complete len:207 (-) Transcript_11128:183-803(-)